MRAEEQYSGSSIPQIPWKPAVWTEGPDLLVREAQQALFEDRAEIEKGALITHDRAISGADTGTQNESDIIHPAEGQDTNSSAQQNDGRATKWRNAVKDLYATEPRLAGWSSGDRTGPPNPGA